MTPPPPLPCEGCAFQESRGGRVCPAAREVYGLPDVEAQRHAETLYAAVLADAQRVPPASPSWCVGMPSTAPQEPCRAGSVTAC
jgi:hypothetical protein